MKRRWVENREGSLGYPRFVRPDLPKIVPCSGTAARGLLHVKFVKARKPPVRVMWKLREGGASSSVVLIT
ncbi:hypothetical protein TNCV_1288611 [Trichonephila clavipes]|nr:hypothetical protein TNCV_1288611 [Trichonephila clavipes]